MTKEKNEDGERCQRCNKIGEDRRSLHMACFYAMEEIGIPFVKTELFDTADKAEQAVKTLFPRTFYTLRVCKLCRGEWMAAIKTWFDRKPMKDRCGSGIFVRILGATIEISEEEWKRQNPDGRKPYRVKL